MVSNSLTRREVSIRLMSILSAIGFLGKAKAVSPETSSTGDDGISRTCECIHQEVVIKASRARLYQALTDGKQFGRVTDLVMPGSGASAFISPDVGGAFSIFRGVITGRHIEMIPSERLVQAWRVKEWVEGIYSIVRFQLSDQDSDTKLVFDHTGFPQGKAEHLASGWKEHYWAPLQKYLS